MAQTPAQPGKDCVYLLRINRLDHTTRVTIQDNQGTSRHGFADLPAALAFIARHEQSAESTTNHTLALLAPVQGQKETIDEPQLTEE